MAANRWVLATNGEAQTVRLIGSLATAEAKVLLDGKPLVAKMENGALLLAIPAGAHQVAIVGR